MSASPADLLARRVVPSAVIALSRVTWPARAGAGLRRRLGRRGRVELFFAFDDPCSAIAVLDLSERLSGRRVRLLLLPVVQRGIPGDPAVELKRRYALQDARRLARREGWAIARDEPLEPGEVAFVGEWAAATPQGPALQRLCVAAMRRLWLEGAPVDREAFAALWREQLEAPPPDDGGAAARRDQRLMRRRGPYDTPAACVHGQWFFAHDRLAQIAERLDELGWTAAQ